MCLLRSDLHLMDSLYRSLDLFNVNESLWSDKCDYMDVEKCSNLNPNSINFIMLQLNVHSMLAHQSELRSLLNELDKKHGRVDIFLLSETFLMRKTEKLVNINMYNSAFNSCMEHKGSSLCILVRSNVPYRRWKDIDIKKGGQINLY